MEERPNILLILADDMGFSDIGCFGSEIETPNLDRLAENGLRFSQMYNVARCCPSRACLLTGLYPHASGIGHMTNNLNIPEYQGYLNQQCITLAEAFKSAGYHTGMSGKWHVGGKYDVRMSPEETMGQMGYPMPRQRGFDRFYGILEGAGSYYNPHTLMENETPVKLCAEDDFYFTEAIGEKARDMIDEFVKDNQPFLMYAAFTAPHWPLHARPDDIDQYKNTYQCGWDEIRERRYQRLVESGIIKNQWKISPRDSDAPPWEDVAEQALEAEKMAVYAAQVTAMDREIGKLVSCLEGHGIADDTMIIFLSDNGGCAEELPADGWILELAPAKTLGGETVAMGNNAGKKPGGEDTYMSYGLPWANASNTPFRLFKHWIHEGGVSTPCIFNWKNGISRKGEVEHTSVHFIDVMPTLLDITSVEYPSQYLGIARHALHGESISQAFTGSWKREKPIFWEHEGNCGMRKGQYKLVRKYPQSFELYDIDADRCEQQDLSESLPEITQQLIDEYYIWAKNISVREWDRM